MIYYGGTERQLRSLKNKSEAAGRKRNEVNSLKCTLMHKRIAVAEMELGDATGLIQKISTVYVPEHFPVGITVKKGVADRAALNEWWTDRSIPASRSGVREALETLEITSTKMLLVRCYGLSLSDQYWICPEGSGMTWDAVNFSTTIFQTILEMSCSGQIRKRMLWIFPPRIILRMAT